MPIVPRDVKKAVDLLKADPARAWTIDQLAEASGVARRTLQKHFRRFVGCSPHQLQLELRLDRIRRELLRAGPTATVSEIAARFGFSHFGRLAAAYARRYGETPSAALRRRDAAAKGPQPGFVSPAAERPVIAIQPFELPHGPPRGLRVADEISAALLRNRWLAVGSPARARYHLRGSVCGDAFGRLRIIVVLTDAGSGRHLWADRWDGTSEEVFAFEERVATQVATAVDRALRSAETDRVGDKSPGRLSAWELTMKALPQAMVIERATLAEALEWLERAMELAPQDPLPVALAAWCHAQRGSHHLAAQAAAEKRIGRALAERGARLKSGDPIAESLLGAACMLAGDFETASVHVERALALDGACAWAWNRSGMLNIYRGQFADATECFQIARAADPENPLNFMCSIGIGSAHFDSGRYQEAGRWFARAIAEHPAAMWVNRFRAPALFLAGKRDEARKSLREFRRAYPGVGMAEIRLALPYPQSHWDRLCEGLAGLGMRP